jgi:NADH-quinone oxidoreductase subunit E
MAGLVPAIPLSLVPPCHAKRDARHKVGHDDGEGIMSVRRLADVSLQPKHFAFTAENLEWAKAQLAKYPEGRQASAVIPLLWRAQEQVGGWVPEAAIRYVAEMLGMAHIRVLEIATFYTMFNLAPIGRWHVQLCGTVPCDICGANELKQVCRERIGEQMHVTSDGKFSWVEVECLGACVNAPMAQINADYYEDLNVERLNHILDELAAGRTPKPGPQIDRQFSAPVGGPTTLTDPAIYRTNGRSGGGQPLTDEAAKRPGEAANVREAAIPKPPIGDKSQDDKTTRRE